MAFIPPTALLLPSGQFEAVISQVGQRIAWLKSHTCPCIFASAGVNNRLSTPGSAQRGCKQCGGVGTYWDTPSALFQASISFMHMSPSPDEPGTVMNSDFGAFQSSEPSITIPKFNPALSPDDPSQPTSCWENASTDDIFVAADMLARYTAMLQLGGIQNLPFQQNLQIDPTGAVTVYDPATQNVVKNVSYTVSGPTVVLLGYPQGTSYMVEYQAAPLYASFRRAGGLPHVRPLGGGSVDEPRRFRLQALDLWTRQRGISVPIVVPPPSAN